MKKLLIAFLCIFSNSVFAAENAPEVQEFERGIYFSSLKSKHYNFDYYVDTVAQLCFVANSSDSSLAPIPCKNLKKRQEWSKIIIWE